MKTSILFRSFWCSFPFLVPNAYAQNDVTFTNVSGIFHDSWYCLQDWGDNFYWNEEFTFAAEPAEIIDGLSWGTFYFYGSEIGKVAVDGSKILYRNTSESGCYGCAMPPQDSAVVMYDFDLQVGDTAYKDDPYGWGSQMTPMIVISIDTLFFDGRSRRHLTILMENSNYEDHWVEGIGSMNGFFRPFYTMSLGCGFSSFHFCLEYVDEDEIPYTFCEDLIMDLPEEKKEQPRVYPSPCDHHLIIEAAPGDGLFQLFDLNGRELIKGNVNATNTVIDISGIYAGMYLVSVSDRIFKVIVE